MRPLWRRSPWPAVTRKRARRCKRYLALPSTGPLKTIAAFKAYVSAQGGGPARVEANERTYEGLRKAGMPEG